MSVSFLGDLMPAARSSRHHPQAMEIVPSDLRADHSKRRTNDRCTSPTALRRFLAPGAFARTQTNTRDKACDRWNRQSRDVGPEISPARSEENTSELQSR